MLHAVIKINGRTIMKSDDYFKTKKAFKEELKANGYIVKVIYTDKQLQEIKNKKFYDLNENEEAVIQLILI